MFLFPFSITISHSPFPISRSQFSMFYVSFSIPHSPFPIPHSSFSITHFLFFEASYKNHRLFQASGC